MIRQLGPVAMLLLGSFFLMLAGGVNGLLLPLRGSAEGFSAFSLGLLGAGWAIGYISGCLYTPRLVARVGHIRVFGVLASLAAIVILASLLVVHQGVWPVLRAVAGFCFAGAAMIVESWLNERAEPKTRGRVFGVYTMINLGATTAGQLLLSLGDVSGHLYFVLGAMFYCMALLPPALSTVAAPQPLVRVRLDIRALWRNSPVAVVGVVLIGVANSAFGTLGAVFAGRIGLPVSAIAFLMSAALLAGALFQAPVGYVSDKADRRVVLIALALLAAGVDSLFVLARPTDPAAVIAAAALFGGCIYAMYPIILAHASDHAAGASFMEISGGLLLLYGVGGVIGPLLAGIAMSQAGPSGLFMTTIGVHLSIASYAAWRMTRRASLATTAKGAFVAVPVARVTTPETLALDPRAEEEATAA